jgi:hypothetical protein
MKLGALRSALLASAAARCAKSFAAAAEFLGANNLQLASV